MRRILISFCCGTAITLSPALIGALILNEGVGIGFIALLLYGPAFLLEKIGVGPSCADANLMTEKLSCIRLALMIDLLAYPLISAGCSYLVYVILSRRRLWSRLA